MMLTRLTSRSTSRLIVFAGLLLSVCILAGCVGVDPVKAWRERVEATVWVDGHVDLSRLYEVNMYRSRYVDRPAMITVSELGIPGPWGIRRDAQGVLLGARTLDGTAWYVFAVGVVRLAPDRPDPRRRHNEIENVFIAGLAVNRGRLIRVIDDSQQEALEQYLSYRTASMMEGDPRMTFPGRADMFDLEVLPDEPVVIIRERNSGAEWLLQLAEPDGTRS